MLRVLQKIQVDNAQALGIAPMWATQSWYNTFMEMAEQVIYVKPHPNNLILLQQDKLVHPLAKKIMFMVGILSKNS